MGFWDWNDEYVDDSMLGEGERYDADEPSDCDDEEREFDEDEVPY